MEYEIKDPMGNMLGMEVMGMEEQGLLTRCKLLPQFKNPYGIAHGGFTYTLAHITAAQSVKLCLGRQAVVVDAASEYLAPGDTSTLFGRSMLVRSGRELIVYKVEILNERMETVSEQLITLKEVTYPPVAERVPNPTIFPAGPETMADPVSGLLFPSTTPFFMSTCHVYMTGRAESGLIYSADLYPDNCNAYAAAHGGLIYTCCDCAVGGSSRFLNKKPTVTVSSNIHYLSSGMEGPIHAEARLRRSGRRIQFYDTDVTDGTGKRIALAQFVLQALA